MKRLMISIIFVLPIFFVATIDGAAISAPIITSSASKASEKLVAPVAVPAVTPAADAVPAVTPAADAVPAVTPAADAVPVVTPAAVAVPVVTPSAVAVPAVTPAADAVPVVTPAAVAVPAVTPAAVAVPADAPVVLEIEHVHEVSLDTLDIAGSGNWLEKRIWYEKSQEAFDEVLSLVRNTMDMRVQFSNEVNAIGHKIDEFYEAVDFDKGQLDEKFKEMLASLEFEQKVKGDLSEKERDLKAAIKKEMPLIDDLGNKIKSIGDLDRKIDEVLMQAFKTIDECRDLESKSWATFTAISKEIDDKKARNLYYEINNAKQNIDQKCNYLKTSLLPYLHNVLIAKIESNIETIKSSIQDLKNKDIDLEAIMKSTQESDLAELKEREVKSNQIAVEKALSLEHEKQLQEKELQAKKAEEAYKKSWSYTLYSFYDTAKNNFIISVNAVGLTKVFDYFESCKDPVVSYMHQHSLQLKKFVYVSFEKIVLYFHEKATVKNKDADASSKKADEKTSSDEKKDIHDDVKTELQDHKNESGSSVEKVADVKIEPKNEEVKEKVPVSTNEKIAEPVKKDDTVKVDTLSDNKKQSDDATKSVEKTVEPVKNDTPVKVDVK